MKKLLLTFITFIIMLNISSLTTVTTASDVSVLLEFNKTHYYKGDIISLKINTYNFQDLFGFQIDLKENTPVFSFPDNSLTPYLINNDFVLPTGEQWINQIDNQIASIIYTKETTETIGEDFSNNSRIVEINLIAEKEITNIYDEFLISNDYDDLLYSNFNLIIKLSDSSGNKIEYTYVIDETGPVIDNLTTISVDEGCNISDINLSPTISDNFDVYNISFYTNIDTELDCSLPGIYIISIWAEDIYFNKAEETFTVNVLDITPPEISGLTAINYVISTVVPDYLSLITITDNVDGTIIVTNEMVDDSAVNYNEVGDYTIFYTVYDSSNNESTYSLTIHVSEKISVTLIEFDLETLNIFTNETGLLIYSIYPDNAQDKDVTFSSSDETILSIDEFGNYTAKKSGEVIVTITSLDSGISDTITIYVEPIIPILTLNPSIDTLFEGESWVDYGCSAIYDDVTYTCFIETNNIKNIAGNYEVIYYYPDSDGNNVYITRKVKVLPNIIKESLVLNPGIDTILVGDDWIDSGCSPSSSCIVESNNIDINNAGIYQVIYYLENGYPERRTRYVYVFNTFNQNDMNIPFIIKNKKEGDYNA